MAWMSTSLASQHAIAALPAPGAVDTNIALWLKADSGGVSWTDLSGNNSNVSTVGTPSIVASGMNFNPTVKLEPGSLYNIATSIDRTLESDVHIFAVVKPSAGSAEYILGSSSVGNHRGLGTDFFEGGTNVPFAKPSVDFGHIFDAEFHTDIADGSKAYINAAEVGVTTDSAGTGVAGITIGAADGSGIGTCEIVKSLR